MLSATLNCNHLFSCVGGGSGQPHPPMVVFWGGWGAWCVVVEHGSSVVAQGLMIVHNNEYKSVNTCKLNNHSNRKANKINKLAKILFNIMCVIRSILNIYAK